MEFYAEFGKAFHHPACIVVSDLCTPLCRGKAVCHLELKERRSMEGKSVRDMGVEDTQIGPGCGKILWSCGGAMM